MANNKKEDKNLKDNSQKDIKDIMLTQEEFEKKHRQKVRERINTVTRIFGLALIFILTFFGIFDTLFEMTYFGWMIDAMKGHGSDGQFVQIWGVLRGGIPIVFNEEIIYIKIFDDSIAIGQWLPQLGFTIIFIAAVLGIVYLFTYSIIDIIEFFKTLVSTGKDIGKDLKDTLKDTGEATKKDKDKKSFKEKLKATFEPTKKLDKEVSEIETNVEDVPEAKVEEKPIEKKEKSIRRRKDSDLDLPQYSQEQMDALLRGETLDNVKTESTPTVEDDKNKSPIKYLFDKK